MRIRITRGKGWYENDVGSQFDVIRTQFGRYGQNEYVVWEGQEGSYDWVDEEDCEIIED